ncbi:MAG: HlyD family efflux transporter periplasmic adaptor subunit [Turicibacter sp.]|nr:HlyD family efflux transporter periplasmic adaptor subunit [Turicibacter sp.]
MKKTPLIIGGTVLTLALIGGGVFAVKTFGSNSEIEVMPVSYLSTSWWGDYNESSGYVSSDMTQEVMLQDRKVVKEILVEEGQQVSINDPLMVYDSTLVELELEMQRLTIENLDVQIQSAKRALQKLQSTKPIASLTEKSSDVMPVAAFVVKESESRLSELNYATELVPQEDGTYTVEVQSSQLLNVSFLYRLKGLDEAGQTQISNPIQLTLTIIQEDGTDSIVKVLDGASLEIKEGFIQSTVNEYFQEENQPVCPQPQPCPTPEPEPQPEPTPQPEPQPVPMPEPEPEIVVPEEGYTKEELNQLIQEKKTEITNLELDYKEALLKEEQIKKELENLTVRSSVNGVVKKVGDPTVESVDGSALIVVSSESGFYLKGTITEHQLGKVEVGQLVDVMSWDTGNSYTATITEIYPYPVEGEQYSYGNPNVSNYPFVAYIEEANDLKNNMYVSVTVQEAVENPNAMYVDMAYIGDENGRKFVYKADENLRLKKEYVQTGKVLWGSYIEVISGLTQEDQIAFPYTKNIKDGVKAKEQTNMWGY